MSSVDNRIVEMEFDNKKFQKNITTTINSIDDLKKSLQFDGVEKGFNKIEKGFDDLNIKAVGKAVDAITNKFSVLGTMADQALRRITDTIVNKTLKALKDVATTLLGIGYTMDGFREYELKISSIQTIAANTGALNKNLQTQAKEVIKLTEEEEKVAQDVIKGLYGVDAERRRLLEEAGYDYARIQNRVNDIVAGVDSNVTEIGKKTTTTLADIDEALDDLNVYADKTIYNFAQMTQAVGRFTTAGIDLETSTNTVKSISNLAALSGATNANLQSAMYNFSQAMQKGSMQLLDWRSIENANMASAIFKEAIMETARVHGIAIDQMIAENGSFNETLSKGWLTNDIMIESLSKLTAFTEDMTEEEREAERARWKEIGYTEEQIAAIEDLSRVAYEAATKVRTFTQLAGTVKEEIGSSYTMMWQNIIGNFDEATELWTSIHDAIQDHFITPMSKARDEKWKFFHDNGGRAAAIEGLANVGKGLLTIIHAISEAWHDIFPRDDGRRITALAKGFAEFSKNLVVSEKTADKIKRTFKGLFSITHIGITTFKLMIRILINIIKVFGRLTNSEHPILSLTARIGDFISKIDEFLTSSETLDAVVEGVTWAFEKFADVLDIVVDKVKYFVNEIAAPKVISMFDKLKGGIHDFAHKAKKDVDSLDKNSGESDNIESTDKVKHKWLKIAEALEKAFTKVKTVIGIAWDWLKKAFITTKDLIVSSGGKVSIGAVIEALIGFQAFTALRSFKKFFDNASKTLEGVTGILEGVKDVLAAYALQIKANVILKIAFATTMLCGAIIALSFIDTNKLWAAVGAMTALMAGLTIMSVVLAKLSDSLLMSAITGGKLSISTDVGTVLMRICEAILMCVAAVVVLSFIDNKRLADGMAALAFLMIIMGIFVTAITGITRISNYKSILAASALIFAISVAIDALLIPIIVLSFLPTDKVSNATSNITKVLLVLGIFTVALAALTKKANPQALLASSVLMIATALAIEALMIPILILALLPQDRIATAAAVLSIIVIALGVMVGAMALLSRETDASKILAISTVILAFGLAIMSFIPVIALFAFLPTDGWLKAAGGIILLAGAILAIVNMIPEKSGGRAKVLTSLALAVFSIATSLLMLVPFDWEQLLLAASSIAVVAAGFALIIAAMTKKNPDKVSKALYSICAAIIVMTGALMVLSTLNADDLWMAITGLGALLAIFVVAGAVIGWISAIQVGLLALGSAFLTFGAGVALAGIGIMALIKAFDMLEDIDTQIIGIKILELLMGIGLAIQNAGPILVAGIIAIIAEIVRSLGNSFSTIMEAIVNIISAICDAIVKLVPKIAETVLFAILGIIGVLTDHMDEIVVAIFGLIIALFNALGDWLNDVENVNKLVDSIYNFLTGLVTLIIATFWKLLKELWDVGADIADFFYDKGADVIEAILNGLKAAWEKVKDWFNGAVNWVKDKLKVFENAYNSLKKKIKGEAYSDRANASGAYSIAGIINKSEESILEEMEDNDNEAWGHYLERLKNSEDEIIKNRVNAYYKIRRILENIYGTDSRTAYDTEGLAFNPQELLKSQYARFDFDEAGNLLASYYDATGEYFEYNFGTIVTKSIQAAYEGKKFDASAYNAGKSAGQSTVDGLNQGFKDGADIHSPAEAKEITDLGKNYALGVGNGAEDASKTVGNSIVDSITGVVSSMSSKFSGTIDVASMFNTDSVNTSSLLGNGDVVTQRITPVMDMDQISSFKADNLTPTVGLDDNTSKLYSKGVTGTVNISGGDELTKNLAVGVSEEMDKYQQTMIENTTAIYEEVSSLRSYISELKIQLDTNALVGSLVGPMDTALGQRANAKSRGV